MTAMDLLPTFARLAGAGFHRSKDRRQGHLARFVRRWQSPHQAFFYHKENELQAVRAGKWKLHVDGDKPTALYDLESDIGERRNVLQENQAVATQLLSRIMDFQQDLADNSRPAAFVDDPKPLSN